jgi:EAL domain-containing protein (putative c-di-GMP-specific phosphodiesterase class I)
MVQGFLFGKPVAYDKVSSMLQSMEKLVSPLAQTGHIA